MNTNDDQIISSSRRGKLKVPNIAFKYDTTVEVGFLAAGKIQEAAMGRFDKKNVKVGRIHATFSDGSEGYRFYYYGHEKSEHTLVEILDRSIDPHFLSVWLWHPDYGKRSQYPVDELFHEEILYHATREDGHKFGELLVAPCKIRILTVETDPKAFLFEPDLLQKLIYSAKEDPCVKFWESFRKGNYDKAASYIDRVRKLTGKNYVEQIIFLGTVQALCYLLAKQNTKAINQFVKMGVDFHRVKLDSYSNLCSFFAIEAAREIEDLNQRNAAMKKIVRKIPDLNQDSRKEILNILVSYAESVYIGVAVLCRRVLELALTRILTTRYKKTIRQLVKECQNTGSLDKDIGYGLYAILMVSKSRGILTSSEFEIASNIKDFGNRIHSTGGVKYAIDAKYAIQSCIHIIRRLNQKYPSQKAILQNQ